jgi:hypothetical protein
MTPELPIAIPRGAVLIDIEDPEIECSMLRLGQRCGNATTMGVMFPVSGMYTVIALCQLCADNLPDGWIRQLEGIE